MLKEKVELNVTFARGMVMSRMIVGIKEIFNLLVARNLVMFPRIVGKKRNQNMVQVDHEDTLF